jgi:hypothetical protein
MIRTCRVATPVGVRRFYPGMKKRGRIHLFTGDETISGFLGMEA